MVPYQVFSQIARLGWLVKVQEMKGKVKSEKLREEKWKEYKEKKLKSKWKRTPSEGWRGGTD